MARMQGKTTSDGYEYFAGIDVSKATLDLQVAGAARGQRFANDEDGIAALVGALGALGAPYLVVFEPTGRYHLALWRALAAAGHGAVPYNPWQVRHLAMGLGCAAKTDRIDAAVLARIAAQLRPPAKPAPSETEREIKELFAARRAAIKRRAMVRTQRSASFSAAVRDRLDAEEVFLSGEIEAFGTALKSLFARHPRTARIREIVTSIPGLGEGAAAALIAEMPEIGTLGRGEIAALTGTAPMTRESGQWTGQARATGGRRALRSDLHMCAVSAMQSNPDLKAFADRLRARGKHARAIITAVLRKLLVLANTLVAQDRLWTPQRP